jgi:protein-S-isoprenylcysteine O-methyltransferase Ste14
MFFAIYALHSYYADLLRDETLTVFWGLFASYLILGIPYYFLRFRFFTTEADYKKDKLIVLRDFIFHKNRSPESSAAAKTAALSYVVKFFFLPLMLNFFFSHAQGFLTDWKRMDIHQSFFSFFWQSGYHLIFNLIFVIDTLVFAFAYTFEFRFLHNRIKSVDPFISGWVVALICYPPFNSSIDNFIPLFKNSAWLADGWLLDSLKIGILLAFGVYLWATLALGFKASNLTNRGIVSRGPYRFIRHPAYLSKNLAWWFEFIPFLNPALLISLIAWNAIYVLRALTEERHLRLDPDYLEYQKKVRWKFIPKVF